MTSPRLHRLAVTTALALGACAPAPGPGPQGRLAIDVAPLSLSGVTRADYVITVTNGPAAAGDVVWTRPLSSTAFGDASGALSYVGPCDASTGVNTVALTLTALEDANGAVAPSTFMNPTPLFIEALCQANADVPVHFDLTVARQAQQGFFDIAIQFNDVFCAAKFDCCHPSDGPLCATDGSDDLMLLATPDGTRGRTLVLGFACTSGTEAAATTTLVLDDLALDCDLGSTAATFVADLSIAPTAPDAGNQCPTVAGAMSACPAITEYGAADADAYLFQVAIYRGEEALATPTGPAHKAYWNVALGVQPDIALCTLRTRGTAYDPASPHRPAEGAAYPYVVWDVDLDTCAAEALTFNTAGAPVTSAYGPFALSTLLRAPALSYSPSSLTCTLNQPCAPPTPMNTGGAVDTFAIAPALPAGLALNPATGAISGTPTTLSPATSYTLTGSGPGGSSSATLTLSINAAAPTALTYSPTALSCTQGVACSLAAPTHGGGAVVSYAITPALPAGLTLNTTTGAISGTPTALASATARTVTATNTGGSTTATVTLTVNDAAPTALTYSPSTRTCTKGQACTFAAPTHGGGAVVSYAITPALPAGLTLNTTTGAISGTPTALASATARTVTATNTGGATTATVTLTVNDAAPTALTYSPTALSCTQGVACSLAAPTHGGGAVVAYTIAPALPAGLALNTTTGAISGTPTVVSAAASYTVTASNTGGSTTRAVTVTVAGTAFTTATFTTAGASGENGPSTAQVTAAYTGTPLAGTVTVSAGVQRWLVPTTGTYRIQAVGAAGSPAGFSATVTGGRGASMRGDFALTANTVLNIVVGQVGNTNGAGGGTFVWVENAAQPLIAAGGGGGPGGHPTSGFFGNGKDASVTTNGASGRGTGAGGTAGGAGGPGGGINAGAGGGGAGWSGDAVIVYNGGVELPALRHGRAGGGPTGPGGGVSGFGGGGTPWIGGGGGGGYSGGGGGTWNSGTGGGGGGSYNAGTTPSNQAGFNTGNGYVVVTAL